MLIQPCQDLVLPATRPWRSGPRVVLTKGSLVEDPVATSCIGLSTPQAPWSVSCLQAGAHGSHSDRGVAAMKIPTNSVASVGLLTSSMLIGFRTESWRPRQ